MGSFSDISRKKKWEKSCRKWVLKGGAGESPWSEQHMGKNDIQEVGGKKKRMSPLKKKASFTFILNRLFSSCSFPGQKEGDDWIRSGFWWRPKLAQQPQSCFYHRRARQTLSSGLGTNSPEQKWEKRILSIGKWLKNNPMVRKVLLVTSLKIPQYNDKLFLILASENSYCITVEGSCHRTGQLTVFTGQGLCQLCSRQSWKWLTEIKPYL